MRIQWARTAQALLPLAACVVLAMLETNHATVGDCPEACLSTDATDATDATDGVSTPSPSEETTEADHGQQPGLPESPGEKYFANDTLLGKPVTCTDEEKECLIYNRVFLPERGKCYALGDGPEHCRLAVHRGEFDKHKRIKGYCFPTDLCPPYSKDMIRMAFDGLCVKKMHLHRVCANEPVNLVQHFFGDMECVRPQGISPSKPAYVAQPEEKGKCVFPNLRHDLTSIAREEARILFKACSETQSGCFARKQVWCAAAGECCDLLQRGPCAAGHRVVLNRTAWEQGVVAAACEPELPCGDGARFMAFDRKCYDAATVTRVLCPGGVLLPNAFGEMSCVTRDFYHHTVDLRVSSREGSWLCEVAHHLSYDDAPVGIRLQPECGVSESGSCVVAF